MTRSDVRDDLDEFLVALDVLVAVEHEADDQLRGIRRWLVEQDVDQKQVMLLHDLSQALENATDAQAHAGQTLRNYLIDEVLA